MTRRVLLLVLTAAAATAAAAEPEPEKAGVREVAAYHQSGQTFVTWKELAGRADAEYLVYRSKRSFDARKPWPTELVATLAAGSAKLRHESFGEDVGHGLARAAFVDRSRGGRPLAGGTGLLAWTVKKEGRYHYCVLARVRGKLVGLKGVAGRNATTDPVNEAPGAPGAVEFAATGPAGWYYLMFGDHTKWTRRGGEAIWGGAAWSFHVALPRKVKKEEKLPVRVALHGYRAQGVRYAEVPVKKQLVYLSAQDWQNSFWWGWGESVPPAGPPAWAPARGKPLTDPGAVEPYAARRLGHIIKWAAGSPANLRAKTDPQRVYLYGHSIGGSGALNFVLSARPGAERIAGVVATKFPVSFPKGCYWEKGLQRVWGARALGLRGAGLGPASAYQTITPLSLARRLAIRPLPFEPPLIEISLGTKDKFAPVDELEKLAAALEAARLPYFAHWGNYGHGGGRLSGAKNRAFDVRLAEPLLAFATASSNHKPGKGGDPAGYLNSALEWSSPANDFDAESTADDFVDAADLCAFSVRLVTGGPAEHQPGKKAARATVTITPRRLARFKPKPGATLSWKAEDRGVPGEPVELASGEITADKHGLVTLPKVPVIKTVMGTRVTIEDATELLDPDDDER